MYPQLKPLLHLFYFILKKSIYPSNMKILVIIPIHKNNYSYYNNTNNIGNYRYLNIIASFSKSIEKIIKK